MAGISAMGMGSGIDIHSLVEQLVAAERAPKQNRLSSQQGKLQSQISAYGSLKSSLSAFQTQVGGLSDIALFGQMRATNSNTDAVGVSATDKAAVGSYQLEVTALARAQSVASKAFGASTDVVGGGTLSFRFGTVTGEENAVSFSANPERPAQAIEIAAGSTLAQVRDAVNDADIGVRAAIINDGQNERLVFTSEDTGAANGFVIDADADEGSSLAELAFNEESAEGTLTRAGHDAVLSINGLQITRSDNRIDDAIAGLTLNLKTTTTAAIDIGVSRDTGAVKDKIKGFVDAFNKLQTQIRDLTRYDVTNQRGSALSGDAIARNVSSGLRALMTSPVAALEGNAVRSLADLGILTKADGTLEIKESRLDSAIADHFDQVGALFAAGGVVDRAIGVEFGSAADATEAGSYRVHVTKVATRAALAGTALASAPTNVTIGAANDGFRINIDGVASAQITLRHGEYATAAELAAELQTRINADEKLAGEGVKVSVSWDSEQSRFEISSSRYGSKSSVEILSADNELMGLLGMSIRDARRGEDVEGSIGGRPARGEGQYLIGDGGAADGLRLRIVGEELGDRGQVAYARGILGGLDSLLQSYLRSDGILSSRTDSLSDQLKSIESDRLALDRRMENVRARYMAQFTAMDVLVGQLNQTSSFLAQQLQNLPKIGGQT